MTCKPENMELIIKFTIDHFNINVLDLEKSLAFYNKALGLKKEKRKTADDGSYIIVFFRGWCHGQQTGIDLAPTAGKPYDLGDEEFHIAFRTPDFDAAYAHRQEMDCICYENKEMDIFFINDPGGY